MLMERWYGCAVGAETDGATDDRKRHTMTTNPWAMPTVTERTNAIVADLAAKDEARTAVPTAAIKVVRYYPATTSVHAVHIIRSQEPGELPVWTIHRNGNRPIYCALTQADAFRVADFHAGVSK